MTTIKIGNQNSVFTPTKANATYLLEEGTEIATSGNGIVSGALSGVGFRIDGKITVPGYGIFWGSAEIDGKPVRIAVGESGVIDAGGIGLNLYGDNHHISNAGDISGKRGIIMVGSDGVLNNSGSITGTDVVIHAVGDTRIVNSGEIVADKAIDGQAGIMLNARAGDTGSLVVNSGTISADLAIWGSAEDDRVVNTGIIDGAVTLEAGDDTFVFRRGSVDGEVHGQEGNDTFVIGKGGITLVERAEEGFDTVKASISFTLDDNFERLVLTGKANLAGTGNDGDNVVTGNAGNNALAGGHGFDLIDGGRGNDRLTGGLDGDTFVFNRGTGRDAVMDFEIGVDEIDLGHLKGATGFDNMMDRHAAQKGDDVWITYGDDVVVLKDTVKADLLSDDFAF